MLQHGVCVMVSLQDMGEKTNTQKHTIIIGKIQL